LFVFFLFSLTELQILTGTLSTGHTTEELMLHRHVLIKVTTLKTNIHNPELNTFFA